MFQISRQQYSSLSNRFLRNNLYNKIISGFPELSAQYGDNDLKYMIYVACNRASKLGVHSIKAYHQYALLYISTKGKLESPKVVKFLGLEKYTMDQKLDMLVRQIHHTKV